MRRPDPRGRRAEARLARLVASAIGGALGGALILAAVVLQGERAVDLAQARLLAQTRAIDRGQPQDIPLPDLSPAGTPARARLAAALSRALAAQSLPLGTQRDALLRAAASDLDIARRTRPYWGEVATCAAFVTLLKTNRPSVASLTALGESYRAAPYLRDAAEWRVAQGLPQWDRFDPVSRDRILNEAVWLSRMDLPMRLAVFDIARSSPAYRPFILRWLALQKATPDLGAEGAAP